MLVTTELISAAKLARRMTTDAFDSEVERLLNAAIQDLGCAGVVLPAEATELAVQACITYFLCNFGEPDHYDDLKRSYDEQKAQLRTRTGYTIWYGSDDTETVGTFDIIVNDSTVTTSAADILAAYDAGKTLQLVVDGMTMTATATGMSGGVLTADFRDGLTVYRLTTDGSTVTLREWTLYATEEESEDTELYIVNLGELSADEESRSVTNSPADILAAYNGDKLIVCRYTDGAGHVTDYYPAMALYDGETLTVRVLNTATLPNYHALVVTDDSAVFYLNPIS